MNVYFQDKKAHAIPEMLGNKSIISFYECDTCNGFFGSGIETDLGNWSKPSRTFSFIRGKNNIPSIKQFYGNDKRKGWVIKFEKQKKFLKLSVRMMNVFLKQMRKKDDKFKNRTRTLYPSRNA